MTRPRRPAYLYARVTLTTAPRVRPAPALHDDTAAEMLTAADLHREHGMPLRTAQRLLARWHAAGHATTIPTRGRPALAIRRDLAATLTGADL